jgi:membrane-bound lytic murein transglycosylase D
MTPPTIRVTLERGATGTVERSFRERFRIGRDPECELQLDDDIVSRVHAEVRFEEGQWWLHDLESANGTFCEGERVDRICLEGATAIELARGGPVLHFAVAGAPKSKPKASPAPTPDVTVQQYIQHYLNTTSTAPAGDHTMMIRRAFTTVQKKQKRRYGGIIAAVVCVVIAISGVAFWQHRQLERQKLAAEDLFYDIKGLDLQIAQIHEAVEKSGNEALAAQVQQLEQSRRRMVDKYDGYVKELGVYRGLTEQEKVVLKMARVFNESEFGLPGGFATSVDRMIKGYWLTPAGRDRWLGAVERAERSGYTAQIVKTLQRYGLPPQFFYMAMQESNLNPRAIGPATRWGRAKGMWQFIPATARRFGLNPGGDADGGGFDPRDERHDVVKATEAAARYLNDIYGTLAQASGLLVVASYNWGEHRITNKLERLTGPQAIPLEALEGIPENPNARNYWRFLGEYKDRMPDETKDYVLKIFAAAVIGENPRLFKLDVDNPLSRYVETRFDTPKG